MKKDESRKESDVAKGTRDDPANEGMVFMLQLTELQL